MILISRNKSFPFVTYYRQIPCSEISAFVTYTHIPRSGLSVLVNYYRHITWSEIKKLITHYLHISCSDLTVFLKRQIIFVTSFVKFFVITLFQLCLELISYEWLNLDSLSSVNRNAYCSTQRLLSHILYFLPSTAYRMPVNGKYVD